jgi:hypothetical protein
MIGIRAGAGDTPLARSFSISLEARILELEYTS